MPSCGRHERAEEEHEGQRGVAQRPRCTRWRSRAARRPARSASRRRWCRARGRRDRRPRAAQRHQEAVEEQREVLDDGVHAAPSSFGDAGRRPAARRSDGPFIQWLLVAVDGRRVGQRQHRAGGGLPRRRPSVPSSNASSSTSLIQSRKTVSSLREADAVGLLGERVAHDLELAVRSGGEAGEDHVVGGHARRPGPAAERLEAVRVARRARSPGRCTPRCSSPSVEPLDRADRLALEVLRARRCPRGCPRAPGCPARRRSTARRRR